MKASISRSRYMRCAEMWLMLTQMLANRKTTASSRPPFQIPFSTKITASP